MISISELFELELQPGQFKHPFELIRHARKHGILSKKENNNKPELKEGEYLVPLKEKVKTKHINPMTGRLKGKKQIKYMKTTVKPEDRTLKNIPKYSTGKPKVRFQDWLMLKKCSNSSHSVAKSSDGTYYGWSHRAIHGFKIGDIIKPGMIGNKFEYSKEVEDEYNKIMNKEGVEVADKWREEKGKFEPYKIKDDQDAFEHADRFSADVS